METRLGPRLDLKLKVVSKIEERPGQEVSLAKGNRFGAAAFDIGVGGIGLLIEFLLPAGLVIEMELNGAIFGLKEKMKIKGQVCYCTYVKSRRYKCGVKFLNISDKYRKAINKFVSAYERRKTARLDLS